MIEKKGFMGAYYSIFLRLAATRANIQGLRQILTKTTEQSRFLKKCGNPARQKEMQTLILHSVQRITTKQ